MKKIKILLLNNWKIFKKGTTGLEILKKIKKNNIININSIIGIYINNNIEDLLKKIYKNAKINFINKKNKKNKIFLWNSLSQILTKTLNILYPNFQIYKNNFYQNEFYCDIKNTNNNKIDSLKIEKKILKIIKKNNKYKIIEKNHKKTKIIFKKNNYIYNLLLKKKKKKI